MRREAGVRAAAGAASNFVFSPLSIHAALAIVAAGARGDTRRELLRFLGSASLDGLHRALANELVGRLNGLAQTSFACGVWVDRRLALRPEFTATSASRYGATAVSVDFVSGAEQARQRVNAFVADATKQLIRDILPPGSVDSSTAVVLANALYFKGAWPELFDLFTAPFHIPGGTTVRVPSMSTDRSQYIALYPGFRALKLPYKNDVLRQADAFYMLIKLSFFRTAALSVSPISTTRRCRRRRSSGSTRRWRRFQSDSSWCPSSSSHPSSRRRRTCESLVSPGLSQAVTSQAW